MKSYHTRKRLSITLAILAILAAQIACSDTGTSGNGGGGVQYKANCTPGAYLHDGGALINPCEVR